jgi:sulfoxide reductase catalytic subunit YedY
MLVKKPDSVRGSEITDEKVYWNRRTFLRAGVLAGTTAATGLLYRGLTRPGDAPLADAAPLADSASPLSSELTPFEDVTTYNNFYEFSTDKRGVAHEAKGFVTEPWTVRVEGLVARPRTFGVDDVVALAGGAAEDRIYRFRCVEGWSMVIPWLGVPLATLLAAVEPLSGASYVAFETLYDPARMKNQSTRILEWPYVEGLRLDEAMHPLTILATGLYGKPLLPQNGAPLRLVVPWKYGFKSIKSIVRIRLVDSRPPTTWNIAAPDEYGFYSNVNPAVDHPRWSQKTERRIGEFTRRDTLPFNGYGDEVAHLYAGIDLRKEF